MSVPFAFLFIFLVVPGFALFTAIYGIFKRKKSEEKLFRLGIVYLKKLRMLLTYIQQHRGLTNSFLNGNLAVEPEIQQLEILIKNEVVDVQDTKGWMQDNTKWDSLVDHWFRISSHYQNVGADINLKQHNNLIANLLYLIDDLAYIHHLGKLEDINATDSDWRKLLFIAEYVGQARALGMGVVSKGYCTSVLRIQLNHLIVKIEASINPAWAEPIKRDFRDLLSILAQMITDNAKITPADYFALATCCIDHVLHEFDRQVEKIQLHRN